jgi:hypothetical protein
LTHGGHDRWRFARGVNDGAAAHRNDHWVGIARCFYQTELTRDINSDSISIG